MKRRSLIRALLSIGLVIYLALAISMSKAEWRQLQCPGIAIEVQDSTNCAFVSSDSILKELGYLPSVITKTPIASIDTDSLERVLSSLPTLEATEVVRQPDGMLYIKVVPMRPVARVFAHDGTSYYINRQGKRMPAQLRYRIDVPVIVDEGAETFDPMDVLPVIDHIESDSTLKYSITAINVARNGDIFVVPAITGMVVNLGDTTDISDKFARFGTLCRKVLPYKGWDTYDTISVKWKGQLVASHRNKSHGRVQLPVGDFQDEEDDDIENMTTDIPKTPTKPDDKNADKTAKTAKPAPKDKKADSNNANPTKKNP